MKQVILLLGIVMLYSSAYSQINHPFVIKGKVADFQRSPSKLIYLKYKQNGQEIIDSSSILDGNFKFSGNVLYPLKAVLQLKVVDSVEQYYNRTRILKDYAHEFYLDKGTLTATSTSTLNKTNIQGSAANDDMVWVKNRIAPYYATSNEMYMSEGKKAYESKDSVAIAVYSKKSRQIQKQIDSIEKDFFFKNPQSGVAFDMLQEYTRSSLDPAEVEPVFKHLQPALLASDGGKAYAARIERAKETATGMKAPDFTLKDRDGNAVSLSSLKGKLVLLDFWGSWCGPCRQTHPHLKKLYAAYKDKGFEIFGVSNELGTPEKNYEKWVKAIDEDGINWINVLNDKGRGDRTDNITTKYLVNAYPTKLLIDKNGVIIKRLVGNAPENNEYLDNIVKEILSK